MYWMSLHEGRQKIRWIAFGDDLVFHLIGSHNEYIINLQWKMNRCTMHMKWRWTHPNVLPSALNSYITYTNRFWPSTLWSLCPHHNKNWKFWTHESFIYLFIYSKTIKSWMHKEMRKIHNLNRRLFLTRTKFIFRWCWRKKKNIFPAFLCVYACTFSDYYHLRTSYTQNINIYTDRKKVINAELKIEAFFDFIFRRFRFHFDLPETATADFYLTIVWFLRTVIT